MRLSMRLLRRDWRAGELRILAAAVVIAVGSVTAIGFFGDRINRAMTEQSAELVGADLRLTSPQPLPSDWLRIAAADGLRQTQTLAFASVVVHDDAMQLANVLAIDSEYPLRGSLRTAPALFGADAAMPDIPAARHSLGGTAPIAGAGHLDRCAHRNRRCAVHAHARAHL